MTRLLSSSLRRTTSKPANTPHSLAVSRYRGHTWHNCPTGALQRVCHRTVQTTSPSHPKAYSTATAPDILDKYRSLVSAGQIQWDDEQIRVIMQLRRVQKELLDYSPAIVAPHLLDPASAGSSGWWQRDGNSAESRQTRGSESIDRSLVLLKSVSEELADLKTPKGILLTGPPGSGKSFLIDLWLSCIPTPYKTRKHYQQLVLEIYRGVWEETRHRMAAAPSRVAPDYPDADAEPWTPSVREKWRNLVKSGSLPQFWRRKAGQTGSHASDPPIAFNVAQRLLLRHWLLVFDEVQLLDISSATLLADVLSWYWRMGGVIVGTSNKVPDDIYRHGVQRERLEPFVEALKARCPVLEMRSERDWRQRACGADDSERSWFVGGQERQFNQVVSSLCDADPQTEVNKTPLTVFGRNLDIPWSSGGVAQFTFNELCDESLGPADYLTLAARFHTLAISDIPILTLAAKNQARRFISLVDALYEARCRLVCLADARPEGIFFPDARARAAPAGDLDVMLAESFTHAQESYRPNVAAYDAPKMQQELAHAQPLALDSLSLFSGQEEQFAYKRALSRLIEMTGPEYARTAEWTPLQDPDRTWEKNLQKDPGHRLPSGTSAGESPTEDDLRPAAPKLKEDHVWGVRDDWGDSAKDWGRGAKIYEKP